MLYKAELLGDNNCSNSEHSGAIDSQYTCDPTNHMSLACKSPMSLVCGSLNHQSGFIESVKVYNSVIVLPMEWHFMALQHIPSFSWVTRRVLV